MARIIAGCGSSLFVLVTCSASCSRAVEATDGAADATHAPCWPDAEDLAQADPDAFIPTYDALECGTLAPASAPLDPVCPMPVAPGAACACSVETVRSNTILGTNSCQSFRVQGSASIASNGNVLLDLPLNDDIGFETCVVRGFATGGGRVSFYQCNDCAVAICCGSVTWWAFQGGSATVANGWVFGQVFWSYTQSPTDATGTAVTTFCMPTS